MSRGRVVTAQSKRRWLGDWVGSSSLVERPVLLDGCKRSRSSAGYHRPANLHTRQGHVCPFTFLHLGSKQRPLLTECAQPRPQGAQTRKDGARRPHPWGAEGEGMVEALYSLCTAEWDSRFSLRKERGVHRREVDALKSRRCSRGAPSRAASHCTSTTRLPSAVLSLCPARGSG